MPWDDYFDEYPFKTEVTQEVLVFVVESQEMTKRQLCPKCDNEFDVCIRECPKCGCPPYERLLYAPSEKRNDKEYQELLDKGLFEDERNITNTR